MSDIVEQARPVAWMYEFAMAYDRQTGIYSDWQRHLSFDKPNVPPGSIRNLIALDARLNALEDRE